MRFDMKLEKKFAHGVRQKDASFFRAALREAEEEVALNPERVERLGAIGPPQLSLNRLLVWPYVVSEMQLLYTQNES